MDRDLSERVLGAVRAVDAAFKAEVLENRIRTALNSQVLHEAHASHVPLDETLTGQHLWDIDWWLTEATMRALHAGIDGLAQLLNAVLDLGVDPDVSGFPQEVAKVLQERNEFEDVAAAANNLWNSPECKDLRALVNHVKHAGFPESQACFAADGVRRATTVEQFTYDSSSYGPWLPSDIETIIDGFRRHAIAVVDSAGRARQ